MRRAEFVCDDLGLIKSHLDEIQYGVMSIPDTPLPYALPLSFCYLPPLPSTKEHTTPTQAHSTFHSAQKWRDRHSRCKSGAQICPAKAQSTSKL